MKKHLLSFSIGLLTAAALTACSTGAPPPSPEDATTLPTEMAASTEAISPEKSEPTPAPTGSPTPTPVPIPTATPTPVPPYLGVSIMGLDLTGKNYDSLARQAAEAGAFWARADGVRWADIEPNPGDRNWDKLGEFERFLQSLTANNLKLITIVKDTPGWAQARPPSSCGPISADAFDDFGNFMFDLVSRYSVEPYKLKYWELGNEPDIAYQLVPADSPFGCWGERSDPYYGGGYYAEMLKAVYPRIKAADPEAQVLIGGLLLDCNPVNPPIINGDTGETKDCSPALFLEGILRNGGGDFFDGVSYHAYDFYDSATGFFLNINWNGGKYEQDLVPVVAIKTQFIKNTLSAYGHLDKYLVNTETALLCGRDGNEPFCTSEAFQDMKADYVAMSYAIARADGIEGNLWYTLEDSWRRSYLAPRGVPVKGFYAFQYASERHAGSVYWGPVREFEGVYGYKFRQEGREFWVIWSQTGAPVSVSFSAMPEAVYSVTGEPLTAAQTFELTSSPLYVDWAP